MQKKIINMAINLASKILNVTAPKIEIKDESRMTNHLVNCIYDKERNKLIFNNEWLLKSNEIEIIITCFHEARHVYQQYSVLNKINESHEVLEQWGENFKNYTLPTSKINTEDLAYLTQPIEKDAILWTHNQILEIFDIKTVLPDVIKQCLVKNA